MLKYIFKPFNGKEDKVYFTADGLRNYIKHFDFLRKTCPKRIIRPKFSIIIIRQFRRAVKKK